MKKIPDFDMPAWVQWIAQDSSDAWWGYSIEPLRNDNGWYENEVGRYVQLGVGEASDWQHSLARIDNQVRQPVDKNLSLTIVVQT